MYTPITAPEIVSDLGRQFEARAVSWGAWLRLIDRASQYAPGQLPWIDREHLIGAWLCCSIRELDRELTDDELCALPATTVARLLAATDRLLERERAALALSSLPGTEDAVLRVAGRRLRVRTLGFEERGDHLRRCISLEAGRVAVDFSRFELAVIAACCSWEHEDGRGQPVSADEAASWPALLGEAVAAALDALNEPAPGHAALLRACADQGIDHPDLVLAELCAVLHVTPLEVASMPSRSVARLLVALRTRGAPVPAMRGANTHAGDEGDLTRIVVHDG